MIEIITISGTNTYSANWTCDCENEITVSGANISDGFNFDCYGCDKRFTKDDTDSPELFI